MGSYTNRSIKAYKAKILVTDENNAEIVIGRAQSFTVKMDNQTETLLELGNDNAAEIVEGISVVTGTLDEAMINFNMLKKAIRDINGDLPYLTISGTVTSESGPVSIVVSGVKLDGISFEVGTDKKVLDGSYPYKAIRVDQV